LTTVSTINPIKFYFSVSEQSYLDFWRNYTSSNESQPDLEMQLILSDGKPFSQKGKFYLADRQVDLTTGTLQVAGLFPNPQLLLRPGQYGRVRVQTQMKTNALLVPQRAVAELQGTYQVVIVDDQNKTHLKSVKVGQQIGKDWIIEDGLQAGDHVVIEGTQQSKEGTVVNPKPWDPSATNAPPDTASTNAPANGSTNQTKSK
jgi:RND family efflux transporter MFP subunit